MKTTRYVFILFAGLLSISATFIAYAQYEFTNGPSDGAGTVYDMIEHEETWFAAFNNYLIKSIDEGQSWEMVSEGLPELEIQPRSFVYFDGYIYLSTNSQHRIIRSNDGGNTWETFNTNLPQFFGIPTYTAQRMIVSGDRLIALGRSDGIYYLDAGADSWTASDFDGVGGNGIRLMDENLLYASIGSKYKSSSDNGETWQDFPSVPPFTGGGVGATDFLKVGDNVIVTTNAGGTSTTYFSTDALESWEESDPGFYSGNTGGEKLLYISDDHVIGLASNAIMKSEDKGLSWTEVTTEEARPNGASLFMKLLGDDRLVVGTTAGLFIYEDLGAGAVRQLEIPLGNTNIFITEEYQGTLVALHSGVVSQYNASTNAWNEMIDMRDLDITLYDDSRDRLEIAVLGDNLVLLGGGKVFISADGENFDEMDSFGDLVPITFHAMGNRWFMVTGTPGGFGNWVGGSIYLSDDDGDTWFEADVTDFPTGSLFGPLFSGNHIEEHNDKLYLTGNAGYFVSDDEGDSWTYINEGTRVILFSLDGALFMSSSDDFSNNIYRSMDDGENWEEWVEGIPDTYAFTQAPHGLVMIDGELYTYNDPSGKGIEPEEGEIGLFKLSSAEGQWEFQDEHPLMPFKPNGLIGHNGRIFANWQNVGYWRSPVLGTETSLIEEPEVSQSFQLHQNYPNPFNPSTIIPYSLSKAGSVTINIYTVLGQLVQTHTLGRTSAGSHSFQFNASSFTSGVYFYQLRVDGQAVHTRKMTLLK